jgi:hypothetical protein
MMMMMIIIIIIIIRDTLPTDQLRLHYAAQ